MVVIAHVCKEGGAAGGLEEGGEVPEAEVAGQAEPAAVVGRPPAPRASGGRSRTGSPAPAG